MNFKLFIRSFSILLIIAVLIYSCGDNKKEDEKKKGDEQKKEEPKQEKTKVTNEAGDAGADCAHCQKITTPPPIIIRGEFKGEADVDCYCFDAKAEQTFTIGVTGSNRTITAEGDKELGTKTGVDGIVEYTLSADGKICVCVKGGKPGAYMITIAGD
jgi:hypothetical protein